MSTPEMRPVAARVAAAVFLLASAPIALAQVARNGPEWGGKDHQPTEAQVIRREDQAGVRTPLAQQQEDSRTVQQLDRQLLHEEAVDPPRGPEPEPEPEPEPGRIANLRNNR